MIQLRHIPNILTVIRILLVPPVGWAILQQQYAVAFWLFFIAGFSDGLDGFLARRFHWQSRFGAALDPVADKALMFVTFLALAWMDLVAWWVFALVAFRDVVILGGAMLYQIVTHALELTPLLLGKLNTLLQIVLVAMILTYYAYGWFSLQMIDLLIYTLLLSSLMSGTAYVWVWSRKTKDHRATP